MGVDSLSSKHYEAKDVHELLNIDKNKLFYWIKTHRLLTPEVEEAKGTGSKAKFSLRNLLELAIINELLNFGIDLSTVREIKTEIDNYYSKDNVDRDVFISILEDDDTQEERNIYIYKSKERLELFCQEQGFDVDSDGETFIGYAVPDLDQWEGERPPSMVAIELKIGMIASELLDQLIKKGY